MELRVRPATNFSNRFGPFSPPPSRGESRKLYQIGAAALAVGIVALGISSRYLSPGLEEGGAAFVEDATTRPIPAVRHSAGSYRRESLDYLIPAEDAPRESMAASAPLRDAVADVPEAPESPTAKSSPARRPRHRAKVAAVALQSKSGLSGGIGKSFQPVMRRPMAEEPPGSDR